DDVLGVAGLLGSERRLERALDEALDARLERADRGRYRPLAAHEPPPARHVEEEQLERRLPVPGARDADDADLLEVEHRRDLVDRAVAVQAIDAGLGDARERLAEGSERLVAVDEEGVGARAAPAADLERLDERNRAG